MDQITCNWCSFTFSKPFSLSSMKITLPPLQSLVYFSKQTNKQSWKHAVSGWAGESGFSHQGNGAQACLFSPREMSVRRGCELMGGWLIVYYHNLSVALERFQGSLKWCGMKPGAWPGMLCWGLSPIFNLLAPPVHYSCAYTQPSFSFSNLQFQSFFLSSMVQDLVKALLLFRPHKQRFFQLSNKLGH